MQEQNNLRLEKEKVEKILYKKILVIRDQKVMLDESLAELYGVSTGRFNEQVKRNIERFPDDFAFQLTTEEYESLISQIAISKIGRGGRRHLPYAFTEHGVAMLSAILNSKNAVLTSIFIVRSFIKMRESLDNYRNLDTRVHKIEQKQKEDSDILYDVYSIVKHITEQPISLPGRIGFNE